MYRLVYVFNECERDEMLSRGYLMVDSNEEKHKYVFALEDNENFSITDLPGVRSNMMTFEL